MSLQEAPSTFAVPYRPLSEYERQRAAYLARRARERALPCCPDPQPSRADNTVRLTPRVIVMTPPAGPPRHPTPPTPTPAAPQKPALYPSAPAIGPVAVIQRAVCDEFGVRLADMISRRRTRLIVEPRQIAMYLAKRLTPKSLPEIGRCFHGRDHTTVLHAVRKYEGIVASGGEIAERVAALESALEPRLPPVVARPESPK